MGRYTMIATRNSATGRFIDGEARLDAAREAGLKILSKPWQDMYTDAYGEHFAVRTRHIKRLPRLVRALVKP